MKKVIVLAAALLSLTAAFSQQKKIIKKTLKKAITITIPEVMDGGANGAAVAWHPVQKKYYSVLAGNAEFSMVVTDASGRRLSDETQSTLIDTRGLWYNPQTKAIEGNGFNLFGWFRHKLNSRGIPFDVDVLYDGMHQPTDQSVGFYHTAKKQVLFLNGSIVYLYTIKDTTSSELVTLHWGISQAADIPEDEDATQAPSSYNSSTVIYTGIPNAELGVLNVIEKQVELYSQKTGLLNQVYKLPDDAPCYVSFNFYYTNGLYWLFNKETRIWTGYK